MIQIGQHRFRSLSEVLYRALLYTAVIIGAVVFGIPFYWMLRTAFMPAWQIYIFPPEWIPAEFHPENFLAPFEVFPFGRWFLNSGLVAILSTLGAVISSAIVGFSFARLRFPFRDAIFLFVLATIILPDHVRIIPTYLLFAELGWVDTYLPLIVPKWFAPAFHVFLLRQFFLTIPKEMDDAAFIDGCSPWSLFWRIHVPLSVPALGVVAIFQFTYEWNDFLHPLIYVHEVNNFTIALGLNLLRGQLATNLQDLMAASLLAILPTILLFFFAQRHFVQGIVVSGVKG
jgi:multiple sugar transport system permease protein/sn-glycerol 3-phosphate transport system permease protein